jgi:hypothetical protein
MLHQCMHFCLRFKLSDDKKWAVFYIKTVPMAAPCVCDRDGIAGDLAECQIDAVDCCIGKCVVFKCSISGLGSVGNG